MDSAMMEDEDEDDTHLCIKCKNTIIGLENYINHRKNMCGNRPSIILNTVEEKQSKQGADVFFQSLELQSSAKKSEPVAGTSNVQMKTVAGVLTRRATAAIIATNRDPFHLPEDTLIKHDNVWMNHHRDHEDKISKPKPFILENAEDSNDDSEIFEDLEYDDQPNCDTKWKPPSTHTGGKWKPGRESTNWTTTRLITPEFEHPDDWEEEHTGGKWRPIMINDKLHDLEEDEEDAYRPPPGHTKGKWIPGAKDIIKTDHKTQIMDAMAIHKDGRAVQYWCGPCNRRLISKAIYEKHLLSNLHQKRTLPEKDLEYSGSFQSSKSRRTIKPSIYVNENVYVRKKITTKKRNDNDGVIKKTRMRLPVSTECSVCKQKVKIRLMGKHLISHYHFRKCDMNNEKNIIQILENIDKIVYQSPFQCSPCKFYANWQSEFLNHWHTDDHQQVISKMAGLLWCSFCKFECKEQEKMLDHLMGGDHQDVVSAINRSIPIIIRSKTLIACTTCKKSFRYNIQLKRHSKVCLEKVVAKAFNNHQGRIKCFKCPRIFKSKSSLLWHTKQKHGKKSYMCEPCNMEFSSAAESKAHRNIQSHRIKYMEIMKENGCKIKDLSKACPHCDCPRFKNILHLKEHIKEKHPHEFCSCSTCGEKFVLPQDLTWHVRSKKCSFTSQQEQTETELWKCHLCPYVSSSHAECIFHQVLHNEPTEKKTKASKYTCPICSKIFPKYSLRYHLRQHTQEKPLSCNICAAAFTRKSHLGYHMKKVHGSQVKTKATPPKRTKSKNNEDTSYQCDECDAAFARKQSLKQHLLRHTSPALKSDKNNFPCQKCSYVAQTKYSLLRHSKVHSDDEEGRNKLQNSGCSYSTNNDDAKLETNEHQQHLQSPFYTCRYCDFTCNDEDSLKQHMASSNNHKEKYLYECEYCDTQNPFLSNIAKDFQNHLMNIHSTIFPDLVNVTAYTSKYLRNSDDHLETIECVMGFKNNSLDLGSNKSLNQTKYIEEHPSHDLLEEFVDGECYDITEAGSLVLWEKPNK